MSLEKSSSSSNLKLMFPPVFVTTTVWLVNSMIEDVNSGSMYTSLELVSCVIAIGVPPSIVTLTVTLPKSALGIVAYIINACAARNRTKW